MKSLFTFAMPILKFVHIESEGNKITRMLG